MKALLQKLKIDSEIGFITSGSIKYKLFKDIPNLDQFSDAILKIKLDKGYVYAITTSSYRNFGEIGSYWEGGKALFFDKNNNPIFIDLPTNPSSGAHLLIKSILVDFINKNDMKVKEIVNYMNAFSVSLRGKRAYKDKEMENWIKKKVAAVHPKAKLLNYSYTDLNDANAPMTLVIEYIIPDAVIKASDKLIAFPNYWISYSSSMAGLKNRKWPYVYWLKEHNITNLIINLPKGYNWIKWDKSYNYDSDIISYFSSANQKSSQFCFTDDYIVYKTYFDKNDYKKYRECVKTLSDLSKQWIVLEKK